jgi:hypothetical protein
MVKEVIEEGKVSGLEKKSKSSDDGSSHKAMTSS